MKNILIVIAILFSSAAFTQTVIPATTTVSALSLMANGQYRIISATDTLDITKDTALILTKTITIHDTIVKTIIDTIQSVCPAPIICPIVDTAGIQALKICPVQIPRSLTSLTYDPATNLWIAIYQDNSTSVFLPTKKLVIQ